MAINPVAGDSGYIFKAQQPASKSETKTDVKAESTTAANSQAEQAKNKQDTIEKSPAMTKPSTNLTYEPKKKYEMDVSKVQSLMADSERRLQNFQDLISGLYQNQSGTYKVFMLGREFNVDAKTVASAKKAIEPGGDQSVEAVAGRIVEMAKALTGGDPSKIDEMKAAAIKGFEQAEKIWGDKLPDISKQTYDEVMRQFDEWKNPMTEPTV